MQRLWPDSFVEESNLSQNIFQLRKALSQTDSDCQYIETIPKRGYRFSAAVRTVTADGQELLVKRHKEIQTDGLSYLELPAVRSRFGAGRWSKTKVRLILAGVSTAIIFAAILLWQRFSVQNPNVYAPEIRTLAVLPFTPLDAASDDEQLRLGMVDALISHLSSVRSIVVRPTSATLSFRTEKQSGLDFGRQLRVDAVLEGTIQRVEDRLRVNVQLVRVTDGAAIWSEKFDERLTDLLTLQDSISERVSRTVAGQLYGQARLNPNNRYTRDGEAYKAYIRGRYFWNKRTEDGFRKAIEHFKQAIDLDPAYGLAHAGLADCYQFLGASQSTSLAENFERARASAKRALELDPTLAEAQTTLAMITSDYDGNEPEAEKAYLRAIELNPNYATAHHWYALDLLAAGRFEQAIAEIEKAQELDPLSLAINAALGQIYYYVRRYDDSIQQLQQTLELDVHHVGSRVFLGLNYEQKGMRLEAMAEFNKVLERYPNSVAALTARAHTQSHFNKREEARTILRELEKTSNPRSLLILELAVINSALGNKNEAFRWLEKVSQSHSKSVIIRLKFDPRLDGLRSDPRFKKFV